MAEAVESSPAPVAPGACCTAEEVLAALCEVLDPEYPVSVVDLGLVRGISVAGDTIRVRTTFTSMGCPCVELIQADIAARLQRLPGVRHVEVEVVWESWSPADITPEGWRRLRSVGVV